MEFIIEHINHLIILNFQLLELVFGSVVIAFKALYLSFALLLLLLVLLFILVLANYFILKLVGDCVIVTVVGKRRSKKYAATVVEHDSKAKDMKVQYLSTSDPNRKAFVLANNDISWASYEDVEVNVPSFSIDGRQRFIFESPLPVIILFHISSPQRPHVAFFHPYCNAGGGGERVLWTAIQAIQSRYPSIECSIYTGDTDATPEEIMENVHVRFNIRLQRNPQFIYLRCRSAVEAKYYPIFTLLMQSLGSIVLGMEALLKFRPLIFVDTMGYAFTYPLFRFLGGCFVASYTHYPTISNDMLQRVSEQREDHNNRSVISQSVCLSFFKLFYYHLFALIYGIVGSCAQVIMVNSSWTKNHISQLWKYGSQPQIVYPPCDTVKFSSLPLTPDNEKKQKNIVSIGQFRPEKNYPLQLQAFKELLEIVEEEEAAKLRLVLIGGVRNAEDKKRVEALKILSLELGISSQIVWKTNAAFSDLLSEVEKGTIGIHSMWNEHFGIGVVEMMAGGLIVVAHDSGGPKMDIVRPLDGKTTGYLASSQHSYAHKMREVLRLEDEVKMSVRESARVSASRFSEEHFVNDFLTCMQPILDPVRSD